MQGQQQTQQQAQKLGLWQRFQLGRQVAGIFVKAMRQDAAARQIEDVLVAGLEQVGIAAETVQTFRDRLEKTRQASIFAYTEDTYVMGGILLYCGILVPALIGLGIPDLSSHVAWVAFAFSFPGAIGFFLARFIKERNSISTYGRIHSALAFLTELGILLVTASLFFHIWVFVGWMFLFWALVIFIGYHCYRFGIYYQPLLRTLREIFKGIENAPMPEKAKSDTPSGVALTELETIAIVPDGVAKE